MLKPHASPKLAELLAALRTALSARSPTEVLDFLEEAEDVPLLASVSLLIALELAEKTPEDRVLIALERSLLHAGLRDEANSIAGLLKPPPASVQRAIDSVIAGSAVSPRERRKLVDDLEHFGPTAEETKERQQTVGVVAARLLSVGR